MVSPNFLTASIAWASRSSARFFCRSSELFASFNSPFFAERSLRALVWTAVIAAKAQQGHAPSAATVLEASVRCFFAQRRARTVQGLT